MGKEVIKSKVEIRGNKDADYVKIGSFGAEDNRIYLEVGNCCVVVFRGIITAEMLSNFFAQATFKENKDLLDIMKNQMAWSPEINEKFCEGARKLGWTEYYI